MKNVFRLARFSFFQRFAHANDGGQSRIQRGERSLVYGFVRFAEVLAAFAVPDNNVFHAVLFQHGRGNFARISAFFGKVYVFVAEADVRAFQSFRYRGNIDGGYAYHHVASRFRYKRRNRFYQRHALRSRVVHLPVACYNCFSHSNIISVFS